MKYIFNPIKGVFEFVMDTINTVIGGGDASTTYDCSYESDGGNAQAVYVADQVRDGGAA